MPLSDDPDRRARQLANLPNLRGEPTSGSWQPGAAPHMKHGLTSRRPSALALGPIADEIHAALTADAPLRDEDGDVPRADRYAVELAALALLRVRRVEGFLATHGTEDERGRLRPEVEGAGRAVDAAMKALDRLGMTPSGRLRLGLTIAKTRDLASEMSGGDRG